MRILHLIASKSTSYFKGVVSLILILILTAGCSRLPSIPLLNQANAATFELEVNSSNRPGEYRVEGTTNLPNNSRITVAAVRYLEPDTSLPKLFRPDPTYSILDYRVAEVTDGGWQTRLNLWRVAPDGRYQEVWQLSEPKLGLAFNPAPEVIFIATYDPTDSLLSLEQQLEEQGIQLTSNLVNNTADGGRYVQARQVIAIDLPTGQVSPPKPRPEDLNGGWGPRYLLLPEPQNPNKFDMPDQRRTDAPLDPREFLQ